MPKNKNKSSKPVGVSQQQLKTLSNQLNALTLSHKKSKSMSNTKTRNRKNNAKTATMGAKIGAQVGDFLQKGATAMFKSITGFGDYKVRSNTLLSGASPAVFRGGDRSTIVRHREYVQDITGSSAFNNTSFVVNPGNATLFPWLASIASCYEQYKIHGMIFEYKSLSADALNSTNTALGSVIMATDYNVLNVNFSSKVSMENFEFATSCRPSVDMMHPLECDPGQTPLNEYYTSPASVGGDLRMTNMANFQLATVGMQATAVIGELWVSFEVELFKPRLPTTISSTYAISIRLGPGVTSSNLFNTPSLVSATTLAFGNITFSATNFSMVNAYPGIYMVMYTVAGTAVSSPVAPVVSSVIGVGSQSFDPYSNVGTSCTAGTSTDVTVFTRHTGNWTGSTVTLFYGGSTLPTSASANLVIVRVA